MTRCSSNRFAFLGIVALAAASQAACARAVRPDEMSAAAHRREADRERAAADAHRREYAPDAQAREPRQPSREPSHAASGEVIADYNPTTWHLHAAIGHSLHASEHERAADALEHFEAAECQGLKHGVRAACPFIGPVRSAEEIEGGVRIRLATGAPVATVAARMRCHLAFARARAFEVAECPLTLRGTEVTVSQGGDAIDLWSQDRSTVRELRRRASALVEAASNAR